MTLLKDKGKDTADKKGKLLAQNRMLYQKSIKKNIT